MAGNASFKIKIKSFFFRDINMVTDKSLKYSLKNRFKDTISDDLQKATKKKEEFSTSCKQQI